MRLLRKDFSKSVVEEYARRVWDTIPFDQSDPHMHRLIQKLMLHKILAAG